MACACLLISTVLRRQRYHAIGAGHPSLSLALRYHCGFHYRSRAGRQNSTDTMDNDATKYNNLFIWGIVFLTIAIVLTPFDADIGWQSLTALIAFILFLVSYIKYTSHMRSLLPPPLPPYLTNTLKIEATTKQNLAVLIDLAIHYPSNTNPDDARFTIPKSIRDQALQYVSNITQLRSKLDLEEHLVRHARHLSQQLGIPPINVSITALHAPPPSFPGIIIGHTE